MTKFLFLLIYYNLFITTYLLRISSQFSTQRSGIFPNELINCYFFSVAAFRIWAFRIIENDCNWSTQDGCLFWKLQQGKMAIDLETHWGRFLIFVLKTEMNCFSKSSTNMLICCLGCTLIESGSVVYHTFHLNVAKRKCNQWTRAWTHPLVA